MPVVTPRLAPLLSRSRGRVTVQSGSTASVLPTPFVVKVYAAFGADLTADSGSWVWTDISSDVCQPAGVSIRRGRGDEASRVQPTQVSFVLLNPTGNYTPRNPASAHYPYVRRNLPILITVNAGRGERVRAIVFADTLTPGWDASASRPTVAVSASGILRRLQQGSSPLRSALTRALAGQSTYTPGAGTTTPRVPVVYWPMEDGSGSAEVAEFFGGQPLAPAGVFRHAADSTLVSSGALPTVDIDTILTAPIPAYASTGSWTAVAVVHLPSTPTGPVTLLQVNTSSTGAPLWRVTLNASLDLNLVAYSPAGVELLGSAPTTISVTDPLLLIVSLTQAGADTAWQLWAYGSGSGGLAGTLTGVTLPTATRMSFAGHTNFPASTAIGQWAFYNTDHSTLVAGSNLLAALGAWADENPRIRLVRLATEEGIPLVVVGKVLEFTGATSYSGAQFGHQMGAQPQASFEALAQGVEAVAGLLYEPRDRVGLAYLPQVVNAAMGTSGAGQPFDHGARYNRLAELIIDMNRAQLGWPFAPVEDDQRVRNDVTASQPSGSSARHVDADGPQGVTAVGRYDEAVVLNVYRASGLRDQAAWRVHLGTVEQMRYPTVVIDLRRSPELVDAWCAADIGSRYTLTNLTALDLSSGVDQVIEGYTERITEHSWTAEITGSPYDPWRVAVIAGAGEPDMPLRLDTDGSALTADVTSTATTLSVATTSVTTPVWTTTAGYPTDFPFDLDVGGEQVTVTAIVGGASPQAFIVVRSVNGAVAAHAAGTSVRLWRPPVLAL